MGVTGAVETLLVAALLGILVMVPYGMIKNNAAKNKNVPENEGSGQIPFGPFLAVAAPIMYLWGNVLLDAYLKFVFGE